jgi:Transposase IS66 family
MRLHCTGGSTESVDRARASRAGAVAHVLVSKYCDHQPLYRQSEIYARQGVELERSTMADWVGGRSRLLEPLVEALRRYVTAAGKLYADDTPVPVLAPGRARPRPGGCGRMFAMIVLRATPPRPRYGSPTPPIAKANIPRSIWKSFTRHYRRMPMRDSTSSMKTLLENVRIRTQQAGRTCGVTLTIWNRRTVRR